MVDKVVQDQDKLDIVQRRLEHNRLELRKILNERNDFPLMVGNYLVTRRVIGGAIIDPSHQMWSYEYSRVNKIV